MWGLFFIFYYDIQITTYIYSEIFILYVQKDLQTFFCSFQFFFLHGWKKYFFIYVLFFAFDKKIKFSQKKRKGRMSIDLISNISNRNFLQIHVFLIYTYRYIHVYIALCACVVYPIKWIYLSTIEVWKITYRLYVFLI